MKLIIDIDEHTYDLLQEEQECGNYAITTELYRAVYKGHKINPSADAISRQAAVYVASGYCHHANCADELVKLPPVTPQPKTGHWIDHQEGRWIYAKCSECGTVHDTQTNYCPNCGAHMVESEEQG